MADQAIQGVDDRERASVLTASTSLANTTFTYTFENFFHPYVGELISALNPGSRGAAC